MLKLVREPGPFVGMILTPAKLVKTDNGVFVHTALYVAPAARLETFEVFVTATERTARKL
jgi:hypothetical protein